MTAPEGLSFENELDHGIEEFRLLFGGQPRPEPVYESLGEAAAVARGDIDVSGFPAVFTDEAQSYEP